MKCIIKNHTKIIPAHVLIMKWKSRTHVRHQHHQQQQRQLEVLLCELHWIWLGAQNVVFIFDAKKIFAKRWLSCKHYIYNHYRYNWFWSDLLDRSVRCMVERFVQCSMLEHSKPNSSLRAIAIYHEITNTTFAPHQWMPIILSVTLFSDSSSFNFVCLFLFLSLSPSRSVWFYLTLPRSCIPSLPSHTHALCVFPSLPLILSHSIS